MGQQCKVCNHPDAVRIESDIASGLSGATVAKRYGISQPSVWRHGHNCVVAKPLNADTKLPPHVRFDTLGMMMRIANTLEDASRLALKRNKLPALISAQAKLAEVTMHLHELQPKEERTVDLHKTPEFAAAMHAILLALQPYPEALAAVRTAMAPRLRGES